MSSTYLGANFLKPLPDSSVTCFLYSIHCCVNSAPMTEMGSAMRSTDASMARHATRRPAPEMGTSSPYPTVMSVTIVHQKESGMDLKGLEMRSHPAMSEPSALCSASVASAAPVHAMSIFRA